MTSADTPFGPLDRLLERAETLAGAWGARARASTTVGQERAMLRLFGVSGLDRSGRPLAGAAVDRWLSSAHDGLGGGIALPFAMGMAEYDLTPHELALEVAAGNVDLGLEAALLAESDRRAVAVAGATALSRAALDRIDANRTARRELLAVLGDPPRPWLGAALAAPAIVDALDEARIAIDRAIDFQRRAEPVPSRLGDFLMASARIARAAGDGERAARDAAEGLELISASRGADHPVAREAAAFAALTAKSTTSGSSRR